MAFNNLNEKYKNRRNSKFKIKEPLFIGRSFAEYLKMFNLNLKNKNILDCAAGSSSFTANMTQRRYNVKAANVKSIIS